MNFHPLNRCNTGCKTSRWVTLMIWNWIINWITFGAFTYQTAQERIAVDAKQEMGVKFFDFNFICRASLQGTKNKILNTISAEYGSLPPPSFRARGSKFRPDFVLPTGNSDIYLKITFVKWPSISHSSGSVIFGLLYIQGIMRTADRWRLKKNLRKSQTTSAIVPTPLCFERVSEDKGWFQRKSGIKF